MGKFVLAPPKTVTVKIVATVPTDDGYIEQPFTVVVKKIYDEAKVELMENLSDMKDEEIVRLLVHDLPDFYDADGEKIPFSEELIEQIIPIDYVMAPLARECLMVQDENMRKVLTEKN